MSDDIIWYISKQIQHTWLIPNDYDLVSDDPDLIGIPQFLGPTDLDKLELPKRRMGP